MKHTLLYIAAAAVGASAMVSCDNDFEYPPVVLPSVAQVTPTTTLPQLKAEYWSTVQGTPATLPYLENGDTIIFTGRVCSSDETGNIFKNIVIQSKDEKGRQVALTFSVNSYDLYQQLPFGQEVAVMASGLSVGGYNGLMQFGSISGSSMSFMDPDVFSTHVVRTGSPLPAPALVDTTATTAAKLVEVKSNADSLMLWQSRLI
ncbi:MAG: hypothetical protein K2F79_02760, partial [Muribaculaceae bacterium]|nr:hypothetical protein [Muribaculaceae bacterium]